MEAHARSRSSAREPVVTHWTMKAAAGRVLSALPAGGWVRDFVARRVTHTLPLPDPDFEARVRIATEHLSAWRQYGRCGSVNEVPVFFEFGAGWDLVIPLVLASSHAGHQVLFDLTPHLRPALVEDSRRRILALAERSPLSLAAQFDPKVLSEVVPSSKGAMLRWLEQRGIQYHAPADARATGLASSCVDCVTSSLTLEHVPACDIELIFCEMARILRPGAVMLASVDMSDHFSHSDPSIDPYHFLSLGPLAWRLVNSDLLYQNRLRASWYVNAAKLRGFEPLEIRCTTPESAAGDNGQPKVHPTAPQAENRNDLLATQVYLALRRTGS